VNASFTSITRMWRVSKATGAATALIGTGVLVAVLANRATAEL
jgi:hypothetical protein